MEAEPTIRAEGRDLTALISELIRLKVVLRHETSRPGRHVSAASQQFTAPYQRMRIFFFHEYGRRVGMVPRSSLKEGKYNQMVEKRTKTTQQQTKPTKQPQTTAHRASLHHLVVFPLCYGETSETKTTDYQWA